MDKPTITPSVRDYSEIYLQVRDKHVKRRAKEADRVMNQLKMLSLSLGSQVGSTGLFGKKQDSALSSASDPNLATRCSLCETPFKKFFTNKHQCCNCGAVICANCCSQLVEVEVGSSNTTKEVKVCDKCHSSITKERKRLDLQQYFEASRKSPFVIYYEELHFMRSRIEKKMPKLKALINGKTTSKSLEQAKELESSMLSHVKDLEATLKRIDVFKVDSKKQQILRDTIKGGFAQYLAVMVPELRVLHKLEVISKSPVSGEENEIASLSTSPTPNTGSNSRYSLSTAFSNSFSSFKTMLRGNSSAHGIEETGELGPFIEAINPLLCPLRGNTHLKISGKRFGTNCTLKVGGVTAMCVTKTDTEIVAIAPPHKEPGFKDVCVESGNLQYTLSQVLIYSDNEQCFETQTANVNSHDTDLVAGNTEWASDSHPITHSIEHELSIELLNPVVSPLGGKKISMTVKGHLLPGVLVKVGGVSVTPVISETDASMLYFVSPPLSAGLKTIELLNSNGQTTKLEDVLLYEDLPFDTTSGASSGISVKNNANKASSYGSGAAVGRMESEYSYENGRFTTNNNELYGGFRGNAGASPQYLDSQTPSAGMATNTSRNGTSGVKNNTHSQTRTWGKKP